MAQFTGYECDICHIASRDKDGWMHLTTHAQGVGAKGTGWDICSSKCLLKLARDRQAATTGETRGRRYTDEQKQKVVEFAIEHDEVSAATKFGVSVKSVERWMTRNDL